MWIGDIIKYANNKIIVSDTFNRADNAASMGNADTGQTWIVDLPANGTWSISSNRAHLVSAASVGYTYVDSGVANCKVSADLLYTTGIAIGVLARLTSKNDFIYVIMAGTGLTLIKRAAAVNTTIGSYDFTPTNGNWYNVAITLDGNNVSVSLDGVQRIAVTESHNGSAVKHGFRSPLDNTYYDNFKVEAL